MTAAGAPVEQAPRVTRDVGVVIVAGEIGRAHL